MTDPLDYFAAPGVLEARKKFEQQAASLIAKEFPNDQDIEAWVTKIFHALSMKPAPVTAQGIADCYRAYRNGKAKGL